ncbi:dihydropteroate synthase [Pseudalkalibacillus hwajinpoensis]|uniref:Dihydropteroate synthase n=1 Tax=Guptibacillus hwajinpoensis TaxID=208199 RepID=A0A4V5PXQ2_9BACL|nr:dihydropteroate synthase [Pseudalkalibacillus hwajinpoensis]TKD66958.1 dihydropteroate synthase [Pseudalkalibacillus hwajinpoensis]
MVMEWRNRLIEWNQKTWIMGILNATPDSFSDGGEYNTVDHAVAHALQLVEDGADLIDIGGESTRPGATPVSLEEELNRVIPVIKAVRKAVDVPVSIDTYKAEVADQAILAGADIINDVWGAKADPEMGKVAAAHAVPIILMHNRYDTDYGDIMADIKADVEESIAIVREAGVADRNIILDPGIGFAKTHEHNLEVMRRLDEFAAIGYPVLLGTSRKSIVAKTLNTPPNDRVEGTGATVCLGIERGCQIIRVHDVKPMVRMSKMMDAMLKPQIN